jgi:predicted small secreted protein
MLLSQTKNQKTRRKIMKRAFPILILLMAVCLVAYVAGCSTGGSTGGDIDPTPTPTGTGTPTPTPTSTSGHVVVGTVIDTDGNLQGGASCTMSEAGTGHNPRNATTDVNGNFTFDEVTVGSYQVLISKGGFINTRYYFEVTSANNSFRSTTTLQAALLTQDVFNTMAGAGHEFNASRAYMAPAFIDQNLQYVSGVSVDVSPSPIEIGYVTNTGFDWSGTATDENGRAAIAMTPNVSYTVTPSKTGATFTPPSRTITPLPNEITMNSTLVQ